MKILTALCFIASMAVSYGLNMPSEVYRMDELDEARAAAAEKGKPLCFIKSFANLKPT